MAKTEKPQDLFLLDGISCLTFNKDFTKVALSQKDNIIYIYSVKDLMKTDTWKLEHKLEAHVQYVSGLDWNAHTNSILSCSYDKTSFVWECSSGKWTPSNVVTTTKLGYLCCKWNSRGDKFCEGTSGKNLFIGYFETKKKDTNWWMGIPVKTPKTDAKSKSLHHSSVVCCEIDPTSLFVLSGSTDFHVCVSSCYLPDIDDKYLDDKTKPLAQEFGTLIYDFRPNCWINSVAWTPSGSLGFASGQDASIVVINHKENKNEVIKCKHTPVTLIVPNGENSFLAVCYDRNILEYEKKGDKWDVKRTISTNQGKKGTGPAKGTVAQQTAKFQQMNVQKKENLAVTAKQASHLHKSLISSLNIKGKDIITTDVSGFVKYWKL